MCHTCNAFRMTELNDSIKLFNEMTCGMASPPMPKPVKRIPKANPTLFLKYLFKMMILLALLNPALTPTRKKKISHKCLTLKGQCHEIFVRLTNRPTCTDWHAQTFSNLALISQRYLTQRCQKFSITVESQLFKNLFFTAMTPWFHKKLSVVTMTHWI